MIFAKRHSRVSCRFFCPVVFSGGFTLIELLLVTVLMMVLAGLSVPNLSRNFSSFSFDQAGKHVGYLMRYAQSLAIVHQEDYQFCFSADRSRYWLEQEAESVVGGLAQENLDQEKKFEKLSGDKGREFSLPSGVSAEAEKACVRFYPDGTMDKAQMILTNADQKKIIISTQERRGQIDVFSPTQ